MEVLVFGAVIFIIYLLSNVSTTTRQSKKHENKNSDWLDELIIYDCIFDDEN